MISQYYFFVIYSIKNFNNNLSCKNEKNNISLDKYVNNLNRS